MTLEAEFTPRTLDTTDSLLEVTDLPNNGADTGDRTLDLTNQILDKIDSEINMLQRPKKKPATESGEDTVSCVEDCLSTEKDVSRLNESAFTGVSTLPSERFNRGRSSYQPAAAAKRSASAHGRIVDQNKSLEAEELLKGLIEQRYPSREAESRGSRFESSHGSSFDVNRVIERMRNQRKGESDDDSVISRDIPKKLSQLDDSFNPQQSLKQRLQAMENSHFDLKPPENSFKLPLESTRTMESTRIDTTNHARRNIPSLSAFRDRTKKSKAPPHLTPRRKTPTTSVNKGKNDVSFSTVGNFQSKNESWKLPMEMPSLTLEFKQPPSVSCYSGAKRSVLENGKWRSMESLATASTIDIEPAAVSRPRAQPRRLPVKETRGVRSRSQPAETRAGRGRSASKSRFSQFVPKRYTPSEVDSVGSVTESELNFIKREAARIKMDIQSANDTKFHVSERSERASSVTSLSNFNQPISKQEQQMSRSDDAISREAERSMEKLKDLDREVQSTYSKKQQVAKELRDTEKQLRKKKDELREAEREIQRAKKDQNSELENMRYEKERLEADLEKLQQSLKEGQSSYENQLELNTNEVVRLLEENSQLKQSLKQGNVSEYEKYELISQLEQTRHQLSMEREQSRVHSTQLSEKLAAAEKQLRHNDERAEGLSEELNDAEKKLQEYDDINKDLIERLESLEKQLAQKVDSVNDINAFVKGELMDAKSRVTALTDENTALRTELQERVQQLQQLAGEREQQASDLRRELSHLQLTLEQTRQQHAASLQAVQEGARREAEEARRGHEDSLLQLRKNIEQVVKEKEREVGGWKEQLQKKEEAMRQLGERLRAEANEQVRAAVAHERSVLEDEKIAIIKRERDQLEDEMARQARRLNDCIEYERGQVKAVQALVGELRNELEDVRSENRTLHKEAQDAHMIAREQLLSSHQSEMNEMKDKLTSEHQKELYALQDEVRQLQDNLELTKVENLNATTRNNDLNNRVTQHEKAVLLEVNEAIRILARLAHVNVAKLNKSRRSANNDSHNTTTGGVMSSTTEALVNLRACVAELQSTVCELRESVDAEKLKNSQLKERFEVNVRNMRDELTIEKQREVEEAREKLQQQHMKEINKLQEALIDDDSQEELREKMKEISELKKQMSDFKRETAQRLAKQFEKEVAEAVEKQMKSGCLVPRQNLLQVQKEKIRVENELEAAKVEKSESQSALQLLRHLQDKVNALRDENTQLKVTLNSSQIKH